MLMETAGIGVEWELWDSLAPCFHLAYFFHWINRWSFTKPDFPRERLRWEKCYCVALLRSLILIVSAVVCGMYIRFFFFILTVLFWLVLISSLEHVIYSAGPAALDVPCITWSSAVVVVVVVVVVSIGLNSQSVFVIVNDIDS